MCQCIWRVLNATQEHVNKCFVGPSTFNWPKIRGARSKIIWEGKWRPRDALYPYDAHIRQRQITHPRTRKCVCLCVCTKAVMQFFSCAVWEKSKPKFICAVVIVEMFDPFVSRWTSTQVSGPLSRRSISSKVSRWKLMRASRKMWRIFANFLRFVICSLNGLISHRVFLMLQFRQTKCGCNRVALVQNALKHFIPRQFTNKTLCREVVRLRASLYIFFCFVDFNQYWLVDWPSMETFCGNVRPVLVIQIQNRSARSPRKGKRAGGWLYRTIVPPWKKRTCRCTERRNLNLPRYCSMCRFPIFSHTWAKINWFWQQKGTTFNIAGAYT